MLCQDLQCKEQLSEGICGKFTTNNGKSNGIKCYLWNCEKVGKSWREKLLPSINCNLWFLAKKTKFEKKMWWKRRTKKVGKSMSNCAKVEIYCEMHKKMRKLRIKVKGKVAKEEIVRC